MSRLSRHFLKQKYDIKFMLSLNKIRMPNLKIVILIVTETNIYRMQLPKKALQPILYERDKVEEAPLKKENI